MSDPGAGQRARRALFDPKHARWLLLVGGLSLSVTLFGILFLEPPEDVVSAQADSFSRSVIGHHAFVDLLRRADFDVQVSRYDSLSRASSREGGLLLIEPSAGTAEGVANMWHTAIERDVPVLLALPKWRGEAQKDEPGWLRRRALVSPLETDLVVKSLLGEQEDYEAVSVLRPASIVDAWQGPWPELELDLPQPQLLEAPEEILTPVVASAQGILLGRLPEHEAYVLSDPDVLNTLGLAKADNAIFSYRLAHLFAGSDVLVVDETLHGFDYHPSLMRELLSYPLVLVFGHLVVLALLLLWATSQRFGTALPPPPRLLPGKQTLIESTADLLRAGGNSAYSVQRYLNLTLKLVARARSLPDDLTPAARLERLAAIGRGLGVRADIERLAEKTEQLSPSSGDPRRALRLGQAIYRWRKEMTDGTA